jgi:exopolysaccharide production protein ExoQ
MLKRLHVFENIFAVTSLFFFSRGLFGFFLSPITEDSLESTSQVLGNIGLFIYLVTSILLAFRWRELLKVIRKNKWLLFILLLSAMSILWSSVPEIALKKTISIIGTTLFGIYLGTHYDLNRQLQLLGWTFGISILMSLSFVFFLPALGIMHTDAIEGAWKGIYLHKSTLGETMFISWLIFNCLSEVNFRLKYCLLINILGILSIVLIIFSKSATSVVALLSTYVLLKSLKHLSLRSKIGVSIVLLFLAILLLAQLLLMFNLSAFFNLGDKDVTLTGRTPLWESLWDYIKLKFWFGYGYGVFFSSSHTETQQLWKAHPWVPSHAHNGYIQMMVNLGFVGFFVFTSGYFYSLVKSLIFYLIFKDKRTLWIFSFLIYTVLYNLTEVSFLLPNQLNWVISVAYIYSLDSIRVLNPAKINSNPLCN